MIDLTTTCHVMLVSSHVMDEGKMNIDTLGEQLAQVFLGRHALLAAITDVRHGVSSQAFADEWHAKSKVLTKLVATRTSKLSIA